MKYSLNKIELDSVDSENGLIKGVSLMTVGECIGHGVYSDLKTLQLIYELARDGGIKSFMNHEDNPTVIDTVGVFSGIYIDGDKVRGSFQSLKSFKQHNQKGYDTLFEMATNAPETFGISLVLDSDLEVIDGKKYLRPTKVESADFVGEPAANKSLFSKKQDEPIKDMKKITDKFSGNDAALLKAIKLMAGDPTMTEDTAIETVEDQMDQERIQAIMDENTSLKAELETLKTELETVKAENESLKGNVSTLESDKATVEAENVELQTKLSRRGFSPIKLGVKKESNGLKEQYESITDSKERMKFARENHAELMKIYR